MKKHLQVLSLRALRQSQQWQICTDNLQVQNWNHIRLHSVEITQATRQRFNTNWRHGIAKNELKLISTCYKLGSRQRVIFTQHLTIWILRHSLRIPYVLATNWPTPNQYAWLENINITWCYGVYKKYEEVLQLNISISWNGYNNNHKLDTTTAHWRDRDV